MATEGLKGSMISPETDIAEHLKGAEQGIKLRADLIKKIGDGSATHEDFESVGELGTAELDEVKGYINWLAREFHYQYKDDGYASPDAKPGTEAFKIGMEKTLRSSLFDWIESIPTINWDTLIREAVEK